MVSLPIPGRHDDQAAAIGGLPYLPTAVSGSPGLMLSAGRRPPLIVADSGYADTAEFPSVSPIVT
jgi:hypothetical protein